MPHTTPLPLQLPELAGPLARAVDLIVIHCSATVSGKPLSPVGAPPTTVINRWHQQRGFARVARQAKRYNPGLGAIGYHYVIDLDGAVLTGRHPDEVGAHAVGHNTSSIGICLVGGVEPAGGRYTPQQWDSLAALVRALCDRYKIPMTPPERRPYSRPLPGVRLLRGVCGHRDTSPDADNNGVVERHEWLKTCPGVDVAAWLQNGPDPANVFLPAGVTR